MKFEQEEMALNVAAKIEFLQTLVRGVIAVLPHDARCGLRRILENEIVKAGTAFVPPYLPEDLAKLYRNGLSGLLQVIVEPLPTMEGQP